MIVGKSICQIGSIDGIGFPSGQFIPFTENTGVRLCMNIADIMRINAVIEKHIPEGMSKEEYFEKLPKG